MKQDNTSEERAIEEACEILHDAYERAAIEEGWETNPASRKRWADVPEPNKRTMRIAVAALLRSSRSSLSKELGQTSAGGLIEQLEREKHMPPDGGKYDEGWNDAMRIAQFTVLNHAPVVSKLRSSGPEAIIKAGNAMRDALKRLCDNHSLPSWDLHMEELVIAWDAALGSPGHTTLPLHKEEGEGDRAEDSAPGSPLQSAEDGRISAAIPVATQAREGWCLHDPVGGGVQVRGPMADGTYDDPGEPMGKYTERRRFKVLNGEILLVPRTTPPTPIIDPVKPWKPE